MDTSTKTYQIDKHKQLIPLNGSTVNFSCFFEVKSKNNKPFQIAIVEQGEIKPKEYKLVDNGQINGKFESDGQLKTYFMVLKAQQPCDCDVQIIVEPKEQLFKESLPVQPPIEPQNSFNQQKMNSEIVVATEESYFQMKYILGISAAVIIVYLLYRYRKSIFGSNNNTLERSMSNTSF